MVASSGAALNQLRVVIEIGLTGSGYLRTDTGLNVVFAAFACVLLVGGIVTALGAIETKGRVLEELSP